MDADMKLSCLPVSLYQEFYGGALSIPRWSAMGRDMGLNAVDINALFMRDMTPEDIRAVRDALALPVLMVSAYSDFTTTDAALRKRELAGAFENIRKAEAVGAAYIRLTAGPGYPECKVHDTIDYVYDCFAACAEVAEACCVRILVENHSQPGAWVYPDFNFHPTRVLRLWEKLETLPIGVNFDVANAYALDNWAEILQAMRDRVETVHINDLACVDPLSFCVAGEGVVCIENMLRVLRAGGFTGWLSLEEAGDRGVEGMRRAIANTRRLWDAAAPKQ